MKRWREYECKRAKKLGDVFLCGQLFFVVYWLFCWYDAMCVNVLICLPHVNTNRNIYNICTLELNVGSRKMHATFGIKISIVRPF